MNYRVVDAQQFKLGWVQYHPGEIPNITYHPYVLVKQLTEESKTFMVEEPELG